jgi:Pentapeptide repeats (8 copies)
MLSILQRAFTAIASRWKDLVASLLAVALCFGLLWRFSAWAVAAGLVGTCLLLLALLWLFPKWQVRSIAGLDSKDRFDCENGARQTLSQIVGGLVLLVGFYFTWQNLVFTRQSQTDAAKSTQENLNLAQQGQITDRFTSAIAQLGDLKLEVRLGGIYALERIANDSPKDHWPIMEVLTAFVREHANVNAPKKPLPKPEDELPSPPLDIQAILTVLGRRDVTYEKVGDQSLDLHEADLTGADLSDADFRSAKFIEADLTGADLSRARLGQADFSAAILNGAKLEATKLDGAFLMDVDLNCYSILGSPTCANLSYTLLTGANISRADLTRATGLSTAQLESAKGNSQTKLPPSIPRPKSWQ